MVTFLICAGGPFSSTSPLVTAVKPVYNLEEERKEGGKVKLRYVAIKLRMYGVTRLLPHLRIQMTTRSTYGEDRGRSDH